DRRGRARRAVDAPPPGRHGAHRPIERDAHARPTMNLLLPASSLTGHPVVTLAGDDVGEVKDVVLGLDEHALVGFTLRKRSRFGGPLRQRLPWENVRAIGDSAVMIDHVAALTEHALADDDAVDEVL